MTLIEQIKKIKDEDINLKLRTLNLIRWIAIFGQLISINAVYFYFKFNFDYFYSTLIILVGIFSNFYLIYVYPKTQISDRAALLFLLIDIFQLGALIYLTGGILNPFIIFLIIIFLSPISKNVNFNR